MLNLVSVLRAALTSRRKTQIALAYAYCVQEKFQEASVFWVHASNPERFYQAYSKIAQICHNPGHDDHKANLLEVVKAWLERKDCGPWLMVIDNADDAEIFFNSSKARWQWFDGDHPVASEERLERFLPECGHGSILLTTRNKQTGVKLTRGRMIIEIKKMTLAESSQLVCERLDEGFDSDHVIQLINRLDKIPLALDQAAAYMQENGLTTNQYLQLLNQSDGSFVELLNEPFEAVGRDSSIPNAVATTWMVSFNQIRTQYPHANVLFSLMSFLDRQEIPKAALLWVSEPESSQGSSRPKQNNQEQRLLQLEEALGVLKAFSFISEGKADESLNMHRLVQLVMQRWLQKQNKSKKWASFALLAVSDIYPFGGDYENWKICGKYLPHALTVLDHEILSSTEVAVAKAHLLYNIAGFVLEQGKWNQAEKLLLLAISIEKNVLGEEHPRTLVSIACLALIYWKQGRWKEAEELELQVVEKRKWVLGEKHPDTLTSISNLASTYQDQGRLEESEELQLQVLEKRKMVLGEEHLDTLNSISNLVSTYRDQERLQEAEELEVRVIQTKRRVLGVEHPDTLSSISNLASIYRDQDRLEEAEDLEVRVLETKKRVLGEDHSDTLISMNNYAHTLYAQKRKGKAIRLMSDVVERHTKNMGASHPSTLNSLHHLTLWKNEQRV